MLTMLSERRNILLNTTIRRGPSAEVIGAIGVGQDITQAREIAKEQERSADDLSRLIDSANAPIFGANDSWYGQQSGTARRLMFLDTMRRDDG